MVEMFEDFYMTGGNMEQGTHRNCGCRNQVNTYSDNSNMVSPAVYECNNCVVDNIGYAQAYVPYQETTRIMTQEKSLACGTVFTELVDPYVKGSSLRRSMINC